MRTSEIIRKGVIMAPQGRMVFPYMTVLENLEMGAYTVKDDAQIRERLEEVFNLFPILKKREKKLASTLSGGEQSMFVWQGV